MTHEARRQLKEVVFLLRTIATEMEGLSEGNGCPALTKSEYFDIFKQQIDNAERH